MKPIQKRCFTHQNGRIPGPKLFASLYDLLQNSDSSFIFDFAVLLNDPALTKDAIGWKGKKYPEH
jgi:hypothetical protein